jgi:hypothetical protein
MSDKKVGGFLFRIYKNDHRPYHTHIFKDGNELGRFDLENQKSMDIGLKIEGPLRKALENAGYLK